MTASGAGVARFPPKEDRMANDYRGNNRGMFGYEGEGYMHEDSERDRDSGGPQRPRGYSDLESDRSGFRSNAYGDFNRGDYNGGGYAQSSGNDWGPQQRPSFRGRGPKNYERSDERIREDVCERLTY